MHTLQPRGWPRAFETHPKAIPWKIDIKNLCGWKPWSVVWRLVLQLGSQLNAISLSSCSCGCFTQHITPHQGLNPPFWDGLDTIFGKPWTISIWCHVGLHDIGFSLVETRSFSVLKFWYKLTYHDISLLHELDS